MQVVRIVLLGLAAAALVTAICLTGCGGKAETPAASGETSPPVESAVPTTTPTAIAAPRPKPKPVDPVVILHTSAGDIHVQLFAEKAPQTVENFLANYARRKFYEGTIFHHVEAGSMIIAGGYTADLSLKPTTRYPVVNEATNGLANKRGTVAMIRDPSQPHSATSQFFINVADNPSLDYQNTDSDDGWGYCVFGQVTSGLEVVDRIASGQVAPQGDFAKVPVEMVEIRSVEQLR